MCCCADVVLVSLCVWATKTNKLVCLWQNQKQTNKQTNQNLKKPKLALRCVAWFVAIAKFHFNFRRGIFFCALTAVLFSWPNWSKYPKSKLRTGVNVYSPQLKFSFYPNGGAAENNLGSNTDEGFRTERDSQNQLHLITAAQITTTAAASSGKS